MSNTRNGFLSLEEVNVLKGIALLFLLWHHLFFQQNGLYDDIILFNDFHLVNETGVLCKMCVAFFVYLSGYGLTRQAEKREGLGSLGKWYHHRYLKLLANYWFIWILFVPIGVFVFDRTFADAYHSQIALKLLADVLGISNAFGFHGYNPTWWFITCIICLYAVYPLLYKLAKRNLFYILAIGLIISLLPIKSGASNMHPYMLPFTAGIAMALRPVQLSGGGKIIVLLSIPVLIAARLFLDFKFITDTLLSISFTCTILSISLSEIINKSLAFVGKHSMNIFLFHTFIFSHWFKSLIYFQKNPILIFLVFLAICLLISMMLEWVKSKTLYRII